MLKCLEEIRNKKSKHKYIDEKGYLYSLTIEIINDKRVKTHSIFDKNNLYTINNIENWIKIENKDVQLISKEYVSKKSLLEWKCSKCGSHFFRSIEHMRKGKYCYCPKCISHICGENQKIDKSEAERIVRDNNLRSDLYDYVDAKTPFTVIDGIGYYGKQSLIDIQCGKKFLKFANQNPYLLENLKLYMVVNNYDCEVLSIKNLKQRQVELKCQCGNKFEKPICEIVGKNQKIIGCKNCTSNMSYGELAVSRWLDKHKIAYETQKRFDDCRNIKPLPFDFYLPTYNICIEFDGIFHYEKQKIVSEEQFQNTLKRDNIKTNYCKNNQIKLIRIPYWELRNNKYKAHLHKEIFG